MKIQKYNIKQTNMMMKFFPPMGLRWSSHPHSSCTMFVFAQIQIKNYEFCDRILLEKVITVFEKFIQERERSIHTLGPWGLIGAFHFRSSVPLNWFLGRQICVVFTKLAFGGTKFASSSSMWFCVCKLSALYWHPIMKKVHVTLVY